MAPLPPRLPPTDYREPAVRRQALKRHGFTNKIVNKIMGMDDMQSEFYTKLLLRSPKEIVARINKNDKILDQVMQGE